MCHVFSTILTAAALLSLLSVPGNALACPFCGVPSLTLSEQIAAADTALLVRWRDGQPTEGGEYGAGRTEYDVEQIIRDGSGTLKQQTRLSIHEYHLGSSGEMFLLLGTRTDERFKWSTPLAVSEAGSRYILNAPASDLPVRDRLPYYIEFLEDPDPLIAEDAYSEFARAPYGDVVPLKEKMSREKLRRWLTDPEITPTRIGLYGLMLGLCGNAEDVSFLKSLVIKETEEFRIGIDGVMAGYLLLAGEPALQAINESKLSNEHASLNETYAAMQALSFIWEDGNGQISQDRLRESMRKLLNRPSLVEFVVVNLARWKDWEAVDPLITLYESADQQDRGTRRAIIRFMLAAESEKPISLDPAPPEQARKAKEFLARLRKDDPRIIEQAKRAYFD